MSPVARLHSAALLLVILVCTSAERSFDYDVDDLENVESLIWESSDAPHMGPTRPPQMGPSPADNLIGADPNLHRQVSEIVRSIIAEYSHRNQLPAGIWVGGKPMGHPDMARMAYQQQNPCFPPLGLQIPVIPWKLDTLGPSPRNANGNNMNDNNNHHNSHNSHNNNNHNNHNSHNNNNDKPQVGQLPPLPPYQKPAWRPAVPVPVFPIPSQPQQQQQQQPQQQQQQQQSSHGQVTLKSQPGVKTSFSISTSHPVPLPKRDLNTPLVPWRSAAPAPLPNNDQQSSSGGQTLPLPIRPPKLAHLRFTQHQTRFGRGHASRRGQHMPQKSVSPLSKNLPADDVYYASQSSKLTRKVPKEELFAAKRSRSPVGMPARPQQQTQQQKQRQGKAVGEWYKVPVQKDAGLAVGNRNYQIVELRKEEDGRKEGDGLNPEESSFHYIHIQER